MKMVQEEAEEEEGLTLFLFPQSLLCLVECLTVRWLKDIGGMTG